MQAIDRNALKRWLDEGRDFALVEVLAPEQYREFHLPGAINVPVGDEDFDARIQEAAPDESRPVVVYCSDQKCTASPKAARRMDELGYQQVYDYEAGKMDWREAGLPIEEGGGR
jgi:rhodanese-related sulfurtransferase